MDYLFIGFVVVSYFSIFLFDRRKDREHREEIERVHESYKIERQALLDRIMANNIHEFKGATGQLEVKKSSSGNFLVDRMEKTLKNQYPDIQ